jgi:hypothetical protein
MIQLLVLSLVAISAVSANVCTNFAPGLGSCSDSCCQGKCKAASCDGNKLVVTPGHEKECVVTNSNKNQGAQCPWTGKTYGVKCLFSAGCALNGGNNCYGYTTCASGSCPGDALGLFCLQSGASGNFKLCACDDVDCVLSDWSEWSTCSNSQQYRNRTVLKSNSGQGKPCEELSQVQSCVDCTRVVSTKPDFYVTSFNKKLFGSKVTANDVGVVSVNVATQPSNGNLVFNVDGSFVYTPSVDFCGVDTFTYQAVNGSCSTTEEVLITTTCGCGSLYDTVTCTLIPGQTSTQCLLPSVKIITVANIPGYKKVVLNLYAKPSYT